MFLSTLIALLPVLAPPQPLAEGWPTREVLLVGTPLPSAPSNAAAPRIARIEDAILATGGGWRAIVVDDTGARHILGAPSLSAPAQLQALPPGWIPLGVDLSLEGNHLELLARQDNPQMRAVFYDGAQIAAVSSPAMGTAAQWTSLHAAHITDDGAVLVIGTSTKAGSALQAPTLILQSVVAPEIQDVYTTGIQPIGDPPAAPATAMNDLGHLIWICDWRNGNAPMRNPGTNSNPDGIRLMLDSKVLLRSGAPTVWPDSKYLLNTAQPVAINHQLEWAITTEIAGPHAKRHAIIKNGQPVLLHGQPVAFLSSATLEAVQLFESAPLFLNDDSALTWLGQKSGATAIFVDQTCIVETGITKIDGVKLAAIDTDAKGFQATREGQQVLLRGRLADGRAGLLVALRPTL